jgi:hypothetical protein
LPQDRPSSKTTSSFCPVKLAPRASVAPQLLAKISRAILHASAAAILAPVSSARSVAAVIETAAAVVVQTAVVAAPIAVVIVEAVLPVRDSNVAPAVPAAHATIVVIAIPVRRADRN